MKLLLLSTFLAIVTFSLSSPVSQRAAVEQFTFSEIPTTKTLIWYQCYEAYQCARLAVPLDYKFPNGSQASVPLMKVPAQVNSTDGPYKGLLLSNPGGPGGSGINEILVEGIMLQSIFGTNYVSSSSAPQRKKRQLLPALRAPQFDSVLIEETFLKSQEFNSQCAQVMGGAEDAGPHMTTAVNARDMVRIIDAFAATDDGKKVPDASLLNYYGDSYGTYLGETFASMFPDRVGNVILDGVTYAEDRASGQLNHNVVSADDAVSTFFLYCHLAGPDLCAFFTGNTTKDIYNRFEKLLFRFDSVRARNENWANATAISQSLPIVKEAIFEPGSYTPIQSFPVLAIRLVAFEAALQNLTLEAITAASSLNETVHNITGVVNETAEGQLGVTCSDNRNVYANMTVEDFAPELAVMTNRSVIAGQIWEAGNLECVNWTIRSDDVFTGPFGGKTKNPLLFISNTLDPVTGHNNGVAMASIYEGAGLLTVEGTGHTLTGPLNQCAFKAAKSYFQTGALPAKNASYCPLEAGPFGIVLTADQISELRGLNGS